LFQHKLLACKRLRNCVERKQAKPRLCSHGNENGAGPGSASRHWCADRPLLLPQDLLVEVFTAEMPGGALEASELQGTLEATQAPQVNIAVDDPQLKVRLRF
jgi:hypothetical protein